MSILDLNLGDQTVTLSADTSCAELYDALPAGLLPPVPPLELPGGVGETVSRGGFGQTFFFPADVLGLTFMSPAGRRVQAGGRTVKNVQGYDLTRLFVGSFGVLGQAEQVTLRLRPGQWFQWTADRDAFPTDLPSTVRFAWLEQASSSARLRLLLSRPDPIHFPEAQPFKRVEDWRGGFPTGMGVAVSGRAQVTDRRFGWVDGTERPAVPPLFQRLADAL
ncbi:FAD-binding oxidoreductase [Deinococcus radiophilus]|uniref:FAD-binding oxidoreductase n=1 Tax=Deinococcus radiophilus TaxID=32062 RepID=A0A3S0IA40_9DEIO|nr:FAD-binding oxidoreductase [Deinococcus radiophilus]RTR28050.1 FAD-binding oxidoreductase [Deinococcus radiophilus]UFA51496.1 FAD-binding oxidoreductase [Deinococcus radiophilus]